MNCGVQLLLNSQVSLLEIVDTNSCVTGMISRDTQFNYRSIGPLVHWVIGLLAAETCFNLIELQETDDNKPMV